MDKPSIQIIFTEKAVQKIQALKSILEKTEDQVLAEALGFYYWAVLENEKGRVLAVLDEQKNKIKSLSYPFYG